MEDTDNRPVGVFDSGVGGLTVLKKLKKLCPNENYIYFGDCANLPYGEKNKEELLVIIKKIFDFFESKDVKAVVMACNTSSATVYEELKDSYSFKLYPIIQDASRCIGADKSLKKIAVLATNATVKSGMYSKSLTSANPDVETIEIACPEWVSIVEKKIINFNEDSLILKYLEPLMIFEPDAVILGCTHYPYLLDKISEFMDKNIFINPADKFSEYIAKKLTPNGASGFGSVEFFVSSSPKQFVENASVFMKIEKKPVEVTL